MAGNETGRKRSIIEGKERQPRQRRGRRKKGGRGREGAGSWILICTCKYRILNLGESGISLRAPSFGSRLGRWPVPSERDGASKMLKMGMQDA